MSQKNVEIVIGRLATDEELRERFMADAEGTLRSLRHGGLELNGGEVEALLTMPHVLWTVLASWVHPRLQRVSLKGDQPDS